MIDLSALKTLQKKSSQSFHQQKKFISLALSGQQTHCPICQQKLTVVIEEQHTNIQCKKGCTNIALEH